MKKRIGVLISGNGSNLQALIDACKAPDYPAEMVLVISNKADAYGLMRAKQAGIPALVIDHKAYESREDFDAAVHTQLVKHQVQLVCLAGFMRLLSPWFVGEWPRSMINIHPSLLPKYKGAHAIRDALAAGEKVTGCTVHYVTAEMDAGEIILQEEVPIHAGDTHELLAERIHAAEHRIYVEAVKKITSPITDSVRKNGFTLVELSIVLIIIGLVLGGILLGSTLIKSAELRSVVSDVEKFNTAVMAFRTKYNCLPGDCINATDFFGVSNLGNCANGTNPASGTCNGNGNGKIGKFELTGAGFDVDFNGSERFLAWQHLAYAGMIDGRYSGSATALSDDSQNWQRAAEVGWNIPASSVNGAGYMIVNASMLPPTHSELAIEDRWAFSGHWIFFGNPRNDPYAGSEWYEPSGPVLSSIDAYSIDSKLDDGKPNLGNIMTIYTGPFCIIDGLTNPRYDSKRTPDCSLQFKTSGF